MTQASSLCFGYGSLANTDTHSFQPLALCHLKGWRRVWCHRIDRPSRKVTSLSILPDPDASTRGLILQVKASEQPTLDARESGYNRLNLDHSSLKPTPTGPAAYTYVSKSSLLGDADFPILQSYLDTVLLGFFQTLGEDGITEFLENTSGWETPILMDRNDPIYPRYQTMPEGLEQEIDKRLARFQVVYLRSGAT